MSRTFFGRFFSFVSSESGHQERQRHLRLRRFQPLVERMEERALMAALVASYDGLKEKAVPAIVAGAAGSKATTTQVKGNLTIGGAKGDGTGAAKAAGTVSESKLDAKVAVEMAADVKSAAGSGVVKSIGTAGDANAKDAGSITSTLGGAGSGLNKDAGAKSSPVSSAAGSSEAKSQSKDGSKLDGAATSAAGTSAKESSIKDGSDGAAGSGAASGIAKSASPSGESKSATVDGNKTNLDGLKSGVKGEQTELVSGTLVNQLTAEATDAALLEVLTALQLPAVQASR